MKQLPPMRQLFSLAAIAALVAFTSCRKCMSCKTTSVNTGNVVDEYPETCGRKATLDAQELNYRANLPDTLELNCSRD
jgi:hypothetical protein